MSEEWKPVVGFEGLYEVSDLGRVKRIGKAAQNGKGHGGGARIGRILAPQKHKGGYVAVQLWKNGKMIRPLIHRVVAAAFIGEIPGNHQVNHKDGDKKNNAHSNLEYVTRSENMDHAYKNGLHAFTDRMRKVLSARRKPRRMILCGCGCGVSIETPDRKGRDRFFVSGHNMRRSFGV
jgi:hypothetical protein